MEAGELRKRWAHDKGFSPGEETTSLFCCLEGNTPIKTLNVSHTKIISSCHLTAALKNNPSTLATLYLKGCGISEGNLQYIVAGLEHNTAQDLGPCRY
jgi:hypothetical protein